MNKDLLNMQDALREQGYTVIPAEESAARFIINLKWEKYDVTTHIQLCGDSPVIKIFHAIEMPIFMGQEYYFDWKLNEINNEILFGSFGHGLTRRIPQFSTSYAFKEGHFDKKTFMKIFNYSLRVLEDYLPEFKRILCVTDDGLTKEEMQEAIELINNLTSPA